ncbi:aldo-keto reductase [Phlyctema vagabunda]|uniref:Aldo-keto reductase n=1 Tax=Phlyctema vagabunda TaxID=108571 RepID=A0ABR4PFD6_9HELO
MKVFALPRLQLIQRHIHPSSSAARAISHDAAMANLTIKSKVRMNSGYEIPVLGYGVGGSIRWEGSHTDHDPADICEAVVAHAFEKGYRHVDSAAAYRNEAPCGAAVRKSGIPREEVFFTSKIPARKLGYENTKSQVNTTLKETGLDYVDLMLIHAPYGGRDARKGAWKALVEAQEEGKIRSLGVSNYGVHHLDEMEIYMKELEQERGKGKAGIVSINQLELHPWLARPDVVQWCEKRSIILEAYSPLVRGERMDEKVLQPLAKKYEKTPAQILLRWSLQRGFVPLPKSVTPTRIEDNAEIFDFELTAEEMKSLETGQYAPCTWDPTVATLEQ